MVLNDTCRYSPLTTRAMREYDVVQVMGQFRLLLRWLHLTTALLSIEHRVLVLIFHKIITFYHNPNSGFFDWNRLSCAVVPNVKKTQEQIFYAICWDCLSLRGWILPDYRQLYRQSQIRLIAMLSLAVTVFRLQLTLREHGYEVIAPSRWLRFVSA